jgi:N4-gp56 family major capsid protein
MAEVLWNASLEVSRWRKELFTQAKNDTYLSRFFGGSNAAIHVLTDLQGTRGKDVTFGLKMKIEGSGVTGDNTLAGNEVPIETYVQTVALDQLRQGVLSKGKMADKKVLIDFRQEALESLKIWFAETMEKDMIDALSGAAGTLSATGVNEATYTFTDSTYTIFNDNGTPVTTTPVGNLHATQDKIIPLLISSAVARAKLAYPKFRPIRVGGKDYYLLLVHPETAHELKNNTVWQAAQQYAMPRGVDNPLFTGALGMWDSVVVHEHDLIQKCTINSVNANRNLLLGAQAGVVAFGGDHQWHEETVDRGNKLSISAAIIYEMAKTTFNSTDFSVMEVINQADSLT